MENNNHVLGKQIILSEQYEHQTITISIGVGDVGRRNIDFTTPSSCDKILGFAIPEPVAGWTPDKVKLGLQRKSGNTIFESVDSLIFVSNRSVDVDKRYTLLNTDARGSEMQWVLDLGTTPATTAFSFDISVIMIRRKV